MDPGLQAIPRRGINLIEMPTRSRLIEQRTWDGPEPPRGDVPHFGGVGMFDSLMPLTWALRKLLISSPLLADTIRAPRVPLYE